MRLAKTDAINFRNNANSADVSALSLNASDQALKRRRDHQKEMVLGSMALSIPLLAIAAIFTGLAGIIAVCVALVVIAVATAR